MELKAFMQTEELVELRIAHFTALEPFCRLELFRRHFLSTHGAHGFLGVQVHECHALHGFLLVQIPAFHSQH